MLHCIWRLVPHIALKSTAGNFKVASTLGKRNLRPGPRWFIQRTLWLAVLLPDIAETSPPIACLRHQHSMLISDISYPPLLSCPLG
ncbi:hypothetical protein LY78DRAFT_287271 [Colletotrichum sublineola]|nr:hypothetical protein LY78DRAFT_287271 [Colletotrichum sublineola]